MTEIFGKSSFRILGIAFLSVIASWALLCSRTASSVPSFGKAGDLGLVLPLVQPDDGALPKPLIQEGEKAGPPEGPGSGRNLEGDGTDEPKDLECVHGKIPAGGNFYNILKNRGVGDAEIFQIIRAAGRVHNISRVHGGSPYELRFQGKDFRGLSYEIDAERRLSLRKDAGRYLAEIKPVPYEVRIEIKEATITDNLYNAVLRMGERPALVDAVAEILAWDINFFKDIRKGDRLKLVLEKKYRGHAFVKYGRVLGVQFTNKGKPFTALFFPGEKDYFTPEGASLRKQFLKAPLKYSRISSGFNRRRFHPILKKRMPHLSVDYAARAGTPIHAVADGTISFAGYKGASGNLVRIRHNGIYSTAYCHLSRFAKGIKAGARVRQGQVIGAVGRTGRATGPHLCFHLKKRGVPINPLKFHPRRARPVPKDHWEAFVEVRERVMGMLSSPASDPTKTI